LLALGSIAGWYAPFVLADHSTVSALSSYRLYIDPRSSLHAVGEHSILAPTWLRNVQIGLALVVGFVLAGRGRWLYIPLAAFSIRVVLDPQIWPYYGLGPLIGALVLDVAGRSRLPLWTAVTAVVEFFVPWAWPGSGGVVRIVWFVAVIMTVLASERAPLGWRSWHRLMTSRTA
jgi:hypothetical protein